MSADSPRIRSPEELAGRVASVAAAEAEAHLPADLQTLRQLVTELDGLDERVKVSPIPAAVAQRGYFTPDEDDRVRQGVLLYRNCRLAAYELILRYRNYASLGPDAARLRCFLIAFGAALVLYAKSLRIIAFAEHAPMVRAKINEPDIKYDMGPGFFDDVLAGYSQLCNYRSLLRGDRFWRAHRREAHAMAAEAGPDWSWLLDLIRRERKAVSHRLFHVLSQRLRYDWRAFFRTTLRPFRQARQGLEGLLANRLREAELAPQPSRGLGLEIVQNLRRQLKPGDVFLVRDDTRLAAALLPGFWTHAALFLGTPAELEQLGIAKHLHVLRHWPELQQKRGELGLVIEAMAPCVQLNPLEKCLRVDHLVVLRPMLPPQDIAAALAEALGHLGKPYDFDFNFNNSSRIVCTELVYRSYHHRGSLIFSLTKRLGRFTLTGDDIIAHALDSLGKPGEAKQPWFQPVALVLTRRSGRLHQALPERIVPVVRRLRNGWRPAKPQAVPGRARCP